MIDPRESSLYQQWFGNWGDLIDTELIHDYVYEDEDERTD